MFYHVKKVSSIPALLVLNFFKCFPVSMKIIIRVFVLTLLVRWWESVCRYFSREFYFDIRSEVDLCFNFWLIFVSYIEISIITSFSKLI